MAVDAGTTPETTGPGTHRRARARLAAGGVAVAVAVACTLAAPAGAQIYWANETTGSISRADLDGTDVDPGFVTGATAPSGVAIDGTYLYWSHDGDPTDAFGDIGRANLDGTLPDQSFIATAGSPNGVAIDNTRIYWTQSGSPSGTIGQATLGGGGANQSFVTTASPSPCGIASDSDEAYWANAGDPGSIGSAHGAFTVNQSLITSTANPCGVARANGYLYWTNRATDSIGRANLDGTNADPSFIRLTATTGPCGVAVDGEHIYWTTASDTIGRADVGGPPSGVDPEEDFITTGVAGACGVAVSPTLAVSPPAAAFSETPVGSQSDIQALVVSDTSSSVLDVTAVGIVGANPTDFEITGDGCTVNVTPAGSGCLVNVRFTPTAAGDRSATLRVASNASGSPTDLALTGTASAADDGPPPPPADTTAPSFLTASIHPARFKVGFGGATFRYSLSEAAEVTFAIERKSRGRRVAGDCVRREAGNRARPPCTRLKPIGSLVKDSDAGPNEKGFPGRIGAKRLRPAGYRATLTATDAPGNASTPVVLRFRILRPGR